MAASNDLRRKITADIIEALQAGGLPPWRMPWNTHENGRGLPTNVDSERPYSGLNPLLLTLHRRRLNLTSKWYGTFSQWKSLGCGVKARPPEVEPGRWGCQIVYFKPLTKVEKTKTGEEKEVNIPLLRTYTVFSADQVDGAERWRVPDEPETLALPSYGPADEAIASTGAKIAYGHTRAYYRPGDDSIGMPNRSAFPEIKEFYGTLLHELAHWSEPRTDWKGDYAQGELRAEIASAFLMAELGVPQCDDLTNVNAYLAAWLNALKNDVNYIFRASAAANKAATYILSFSRPKEPETVLMDEAVMA
ncbi:ArdC family protein [Tundrisphaera sp. TA3]|uniref:ArdC family protein n=1 Tax=Tundrisphaera sp. TA3 TaxID=3435775 RepID=UPI003EB87DAF